MINLLPPEQKRELAVQRGKRLIIVLGIIIIIPVICFILILLSINVYILGEVNAEKITFQQNENQYQTPDFLSFKKIIQENNATLTELQSFYDKEIYFNQVLGIISNISRPKNLFLTNLAITRVNKKIEISASGFSDSRNDLLVYQKNMQQDSSIKNVSFSPQSWVDPQNVSFDVTFEVSP